MVTFARKVYDFVKDNKIIIAVTGLSIVSVPLVSLVLRQSGYTLHKVEGPSMRPTLNPGGYCVIYFLRLREKYENILNFLR
jgi:hypothetical protein